MLALAPGLLLFPLLRALPDHVEQILLVFFERLLAGRPFLFAGRWRTSRWTNIRHLFGCPAIERDHIQVIPARERDALFIVREMRIAFRCRLFW